jgi:Membrane bound O-acyl transferase family
LGTFARFISCDILKLPHPSILERYTHTTLVFILSGLVHVLCFIAWGLSAREPGPMIFFTVFALGIMVEDGVQAIWRRFSDASKVNGRVPLWQKIVGFIWVMCWICVALPWLIYPMLRLKPQVFPFSVVEKIGVPTAGAGVALGALVLIFMFSPQF